jgi:hypothetical protein
VKRFAFLLGMAAVAVSASTARADVSYLYVADVASGTGAAGSTVTVNIYLQETVSKGSSYIAAEGGLFAAGYQINRTAGDGFVSAQAGQIGPGQSFAGGFATPTGAANSSTSLWRLVESGASNPATSLGTVSGNITKVLLGTETFQVGTMNSTFTIGKKTSGTNTTTETSQTNLDIDNASLGITGVDSNVTTVTINVQTIGTVPEPSSMALCGLAGCSMGIGAWRRYKAKKVATAAKLEEVAV